MPRTSVGGCDQLGGLVACKSILPCKAAPAHGKRMGTGFRSLRTGVIRISDFGSLKGSVQTPKSNPIQNTVSAVPDPVSRTPCPKPRSCS